MDMCGGCWNCPGLLPVELGSVKVKDVPLSATYRERYPVTLFCWDGGTAHTLFSVQNQPLSTAQEAR